MNIKLNHDSVRRSWQSAKQDPEIVESMLKENNEDET